MYINANTLKTYSTHSEIRSSFPQVSFPAVINDALLADFSIFPVSAVPAPSYNEATHDIREATPEQVNGAWQQKWETYALSAQEAADKTAAKAAKVRELRNEKLSACDWTQLADTPGQTRAAYVQYRQDLRNVPQQAGFPWSITWPAEPQ